MPPKRQAPMTPSGSSKNALAQFRKAATAKALGSRSLFSSVGTRSAPAQPADEADDAEQRDLSFARVRTPTSTERCGEEGGMTRPLFEVLPGNKQHPSETKTEAKAPCGGIQQSTTRTSIATHRKPLEATQNKKDTVSAKQDQSTKKRAKLNPNDVEGSPTVAGDESSKTEYLIELPEPMSSRNELILDVPSDESSLRPLLSPVGPTLIRSNRKGAVGTPRQNASSTGKQLVHPQTSKPPEVSTKPPQELPPRLSKRDMFLQQCQEGKLSAKSLDELAAYNPSSRNSGASRRKAETLANDYHVPGVVDTICAQLSQFSAMSYKKGSHFPPLSADCCETFSVFCALAFSSVQDAAELKRLLKGSIGKEDGLTWWLYVAAWLHQLTSQKWKFSGKKQRPMIDDVVHCLNLQYHYPSVELQSSNFQVVFYHQIETALRLVHEMRVYVDYQYQQQQKKKVASTRGKRVRDDGSSGPREKMVKGYVIVSGDFTFSIFAILPSTSSGKGSLGIMDSHGCLPWSDGKASLSVFEDHPEKRSATAQATVGDEDHFVQVLFALLEDTRETHKRAPPPKRGAKAAGPVELQLLDDSFEEVQVVQAPRPATPPPKALASYMTWTPIYDVPQRYAPVEFTGRSAGSQGPKLVPERASAHDVLSVVEGVIRSVLTETSSKELISERARHQHVKTNPNLLPYWVKLGEQTVQQ